jgi:hypothetical protein
VPLARQCNRRVSVQKRDARRGVLGNVAGDDGTIRLESLGSEPGLDEIYAE